MRLLIAEDDPGTARALLAGLEALGHEMVVAEDGRAALALASDGGFDALLLDVMLPFVDGIALTGALRERGVDVPIMLVTALGDLADRIAGLDAGADDYIVKPAAPAEIAARLRAILRRAERQGGSGAMRAGDIEVNEVKHRAARAGRPLALPKLEFRMLCELVRHKNGVVSRAMFYRAVWGLDAEPATNLVESYIRRLRTHLVSGGQSDPIETIRGVGYMLVDRTEKARSERMLEPGFRRSSGDQNLALISAPKVRGALKLP